MCAVFASSYVKTNGTALTRNRDQLSFTYNARPQAMTVYVRWLDRGTGQVASARIVQVGSSAGSDPLLQIASDGDGTFTATFHNGNSSVTSATTVATSINDMVEHRLTLAASGALQLHQSVAGATEVAGSTSAGLTLPQTWSGTKLWFNSVGTSNVGFAAPTNKHIARGVQSLETMRRMAGTK